MEMRSCGQPLHSDELSWQASIEFRSERFRLLPMCAIASS
jgi:hypothetical protein